MGFNDELLVSLPAVLRSSGSAFRFRQIAWPAFTFCCFGSCLLRLWHVPLAVVPSDKGQRRAPSTSCPRPLLTVVASQHSFLSYVSLATMTLDRFAVTSNGFLPAEPPLARLPDAYYDPWECIVHDLPRLLHDGTLRAAVRALPVLDTARLADEPAWRRAYVVLAFLTHAHVWGGDVPCEVLPPAIAVPLLAVAAHLELPPVATYAALNLWNAASSTGDWADLDTLTALHTFTGTVSESWFYTVSVAMECRAAPAIALLYDAVQSAGPDADADPDVARTALRTLVTVLADVGRLLDRMHEHCHPDVFFWDIRPFLAGSRNMAAQGLPRGVFYDEGDGRGGWHTLRGGSNGQSSLLQFFDAVLGVRHASTGSLGSGGDGVAFHDEVRGYMPGPHRRFLEHVATLPTFQDLVVASGDADLAAAYEDATAALAGLRNKHLAIVTRYIILPSKRPRPHPPATGGDTFRARGLAAAPTADGAAAQTDRSDRVERVDRTDRTDTDERFTGTGGTDLLPFLKQTRDETLLAGHVARARVPPLGQGDPAAAVCHVQS